MVKNLDYVIETINDLDVNYNNTIVIFGSIGEDIQWFKQIFEEYHLSSGVSIALILMGILIAFKGITIIYKIILICHGEFEFVKKYLAYRQTYRQNNRDD